MTQAMTRPLFSLKVPATTANLGSGFDTLGMALTLYNVFNVTKLLPEGEFSCEVCGEVESQAVVAGTPFIRVQPVGGSMYPDESMVLTVQAEATGLGWLTYEWQFAESADGPFETLTGQDGSNNPTCVADRDGYYRVRVTQVAGSDSNAVDSVAVRVHIHNMTLWSVDTSSNTATRQPQSLMKGKRSRS